MCIPMQWSVNVRLPYFGWFGQSGFSTERDARTWIAGQYRDARKATDSRLGRPSYAARSYTIRPHIITPESCQ